MQVCGLHESKRRVDQAEERANYEVLQLNNEGFIVALL